jgi:hypothetical protein
MDYRIAGSRSWEIQQDAGLFDAMDMAPKTFVAALKGEIAAML